MNQYPAYKESDIEWLGEVPEHWSLRKLKYAVTLTKEDAEERHEDFQIALENIESWTGQFIETDSDYRGSGDAFEKGDILFNKLRPYLAKVYHAKRAGTPVGELLVLRPETDILSRFLFYRLLSAEFIDVVDGSTYGAKMPRASWDFIGDLSIPIPPLPEQRTIAAYLDRKTEQIDTLIAKKQRLIDLLQEQRTAIINRAVTQGLDPDVPMQDSGIEWLGEVPAHWDTGKLRHVAQFYGGGTPSKSNDEYWQGDIPWVSPKDMKTDWVSDTEDHVTEEAIEESSTKLVEEGAVLLVVRSGILRHSLPVAINTRPVTLNQDMKAIVPDGSLRPDYLRFYIVGNESNLLHEWRKQGATVESIEQQFLAEHKVPLPPIKEQSVIVDFLKNRCQEIERTIDKEKKMIHFLQELRTSLISEVVTGKLDVRDEVSEPAEVAA